MAADGRTFLGRHGLGPAERTDSLVFHNRLSTTGPLAFHTGLSSLPITCRPSSATPRRTTKSIRLLPYFRLKLLASPLSKAARTI